MPWQARSIVSQREEFAALASAGTLTSTCAVSSLTVWLIELSAPFLGGAATGLCIRTRRGAIQTALILLPLTMGLVFIKTGTRSVGAYLADPNSPSYKSNSGAGDAPFTLRPGVDAALSAAAALCAGGVVGFALRRTIDAVRPSGGTVDL